jgi:hypothetical protein
MDAAAAGDGYSQQSQLNEVVSWGGEEEEEHTTISIARRVRRK